MKRDIITIDDLSNDEIEGIFDLADEFLDAFSDKQNGDKITGRQSVAAGRILSTLFHEPSTRTRLSFESAMIRLGGNIISSNDPSSSSAAKGESLADTVRVLESYADVLVIRHPSEGAARLAANYVQIPVINGGDGGHEHPTQTLCDLYTLRREKKTLKGLTVLLTGDLKNGRTVHSLVYGLARFGAQIQTFATEGLELPNHVTRRLQTDYHCAVGKVQIGPGKIGAIYSVPSPARPHQLRLLPLGDPSLGDVVVTQVDVCYVTRLQKERLASDESVGNYTVVNQEFLKGKQYKTTSVLHPLPRREELAYDLDTDPRGVYFKQAAYGVPVRMALLATVLGLKPWKGTASKSDGLYESCVTQPGGVTCGNHRCITSVENERRYMPLTFWVIKQLPFTLRCIYCEHEITPQIVGDVTKKKYYCDVLSRQLIAPSELIIFMDEMNAQDAHYEKGFRKKKPKTAECSVD